MMSEMDEIECMDTGATTCKKCTFGSCVKNLNIRANTHEGRGRGRGKREIEN